VAERSGDTAFDFTEAPGNSEPPEIMLYPYSKKLRNFDKVFLLCVSPFAPVQNPLVARASVQAFPAADQTAHTLQGNPPSQQLS
jgi:hypothetical protein